MPTSSYFSKNVYTASGSTPNFAITIPYQDEDEITVTVNSAVAAFTFLTPSTVQLASTPAAGATVIIQRTTRIDRAKVDFKDGSTLTGSDLDTSELQLLYAIQELTEQLGLLQAQINAISITNGNLPAVDTTKNGYVLQVVGGVWTLVPTTAVTLLADSIVDGTNRKIQKKTQAVTVVGTPASVSAAIDVHTGTAC